MATTEGDTRLPKKLAKERNQCEQFDQAWLLGVVSSIS